MVDYFGCIYYFNAFYTNVALNTLPFLSLGLLFIESVGYYYLLVYYLYLLPDVVMLTDFLFVSLVLIFYSLSPFLFFLSIYFPFHFGPLRLALFCSNLPRINFLVGLLSSFKLIYTFCLFFLVLGSGLSNLVTHTT